MHERNKTERSAARQAVIYAADALRSSEVHTVAGCKNAAADFPISYRFKEPTKSIAARWNVGQPFGFSVFDQGKKAPPKRREFDPFRSDRLAIRPSKAHSFVMRTRIEPEDKLAEQDGAIERGHEAWQRAKIERGLAQAQDRTSLIPIDRILRDFGLER